VEEKWAESSKSLPTRAQFFRSGKQKKANKIF
jgi:hypothetical protein